MPDKIQRVARGLAELLSLAGGRTPQLLVDDVQSTLDLLQFYGLQQLQTRTSTDPAAVQGSGTGITLSSTSWTVLFGVDMAVTLAAAMTALSAGILLRRNTSGFIGVAESSYLGAFSAGGTYQLSWRPAYPVLCPPGTIAFAGMNKLAGVANAALTTTAEFGTLG